MPTDAASRATDERLTSFSWLPPSIGEYSLARTWHIGQSSDSGGEARSKRRSATTRPAPRRASVGRGVARLLWGAADGCAPRCLLEDPALFREVVRFKAAQTGFVPRLIEKDYFCTVVLEYLAASRAELVFRGGPCRLATRACGSWSRKSERGRHGKRTWTTSTMTTIPFTECDTRES